jgi:hypothetical protein
MSKTTRKNRRNSREKLTLELFQKIASLTFVREMAPVWKRINSEPFHIQRNSSLEQFRNGCGFCTTNERETSPSRRHMIERCRSVAILAQIAPQQRLRDGSDIMCARKRETTSPQTDDDGLSIPQCDSQVARVLVQSYHELSFIEFKQQTHLKLLHLKSTDVHK